MKFCWILHQENTTFNYFSLSNFHSWTQLPSTTTVDTASRISPHRPFGTTHQNFFLVPGEFLSHTYLTISRKYCTRRMTYYSIDNLTVYSNSIIVSGITHQLEYVSPVDWFDYGKGISNTYPIEFSLHLSCSPLMVMLGWPLNKNNGSFIAEISAL